MSPDPVLGLIQKSSRPDFDTINGDGMFDAAHTDAELEQIQRAGFNNIRLQTLSYWAWLTDREGFLKILRTIADICERRGLTITATIWSSTGYGPLISGRPPLYTFVPRSSADIDRAGLLRSIWNRAQELADSYRLKIWDDEDEYWRRGVLLPEGPLFGAPYAEPDNWAMHPAVLAWAPGLYGSLAQYVIDLGEFFSRPGSVGRRVLAGYDLFNEADAAWARPPASQSQTLDFITATYLILAESHRQNQAPPPPCTVGWSSPDGLINGTTSLSGLVEQTVPLSYYSTHFYGDASVFERTIQIPREEARFAGKPYVCSEFWDANHSSASTEEVLKSLTRLDAGGQMWGFLESNWPYGPPRFRRVLPDGILVPELANPTLWSISWPQRSEISFSINTVGRSGVDRTRDLDAIRSWCQTRCLVP